MNEDPLASSRSASADGGGLRTVELEAADRAALFVEVVRAFLAALVAPEDVQPRETRVLERSAGSLAELLDTWVAELLLISTAEKVLIGRAQVDVADTRGGLHLHATLRGEPRNPERHRVRCEPTRAWVELLESGPRFRARLGIEGHGGA